MDNLEIVTFISQTTVDNERFVVPFNTALARPGLRTIVDVQDFRAGESLIASIFDRGIYQSNAIIIIVSKNTPGRQWVRAELEHAVLRNIEEKIPVITIVLDEADVPPPLRTALQIRVPSSRTPQEVADEVARILLEERRPAAPVTMVPNSRWALATLHGVDSETPLDEYVARYAIEQFLTSNTEYVDVSSLLNELKTQSEGSEADLEASLHVLEQEGVIQRQHEIGARLPFAFSLTQRGATLLLEKYVPELLHQTYEQIVARLKQSYPAGIEIGQTAMDLAAPPLLVLQVGKALEARGAARVVQYMGGWGDVIPTATIRRL